MATPQRWYVLLIMVIASIFLVLLAGNLEDWRTPDIVPLPLLAVGILGSAISIFVLSLGYAVIVIFGGPTQTVPKIMLGLVALLATACAVMTGIEVAGHEEWIAHTHSTLLIVTALLYTALATRLAAIFDQEIAERNDDHVETLRRPAAVFQPETTLEM